MYTPDITALAAAVGMGLTVIGLGRCCIFLKSQQSERYFKINNVTYKHMQIVKAKCSPIKFAKKA